MLSAENLTKVLRTFASTLVTDYPLERTLTSLCDEIVGVLDAEGAGVMLEDEAGHLRFIAASNDTVRMIEALQIELAEGPCLHAYRTAEVTLVPDLANDERFPKFSERACGAGMASVHSFPLVSGGDCVGALNLYSTEVAPFDDDEVQAGRLLADMCTAYILNSRTLSRSEELAGQLQHALNSRVVIEQAKGRLAEQLGVEVGDAFEILRRHARNNGLKLREVALDVVEGRLRLSR